MNSAGVAEMLKLPQWFSCYTHMTALSGLDSGAGRVMSGGVVHFWTQVTPNVKHKKKRQITSLPEICQWDTCV